MTTQLTPMMQQWQECKHKAKDALLLFRLGDFYEAFYEDAHKASEALQLTLTQRSGVAMCGVPAVSVDTYIDKLVEKGIKVAIAEQVEDPKETKGIVKREVVRTVSKGTLLDSKLLKDKAHNYFAFLIHEKENFGLCFVDVTTADLCALECSHLTQLLDELVKVHPAEIILDPALEKRFPSLLSELSLHLSFAANFYDPQCLTLTAEKQILARFPEKNLAFLQNLPLAKKAASLCLHYLETERHLDLGAFSSIRTESFAKYMAIDRSTRQNLELITPLFASSQSPTLLSLLDKTQTAMGGRLLSYWIQHPLVDVVAIEKRQQSVAYFLQHPHVMKELITLLKHVRDLERLSSRMQTKIATSRDYVALGYSLPLIQKIQQLLQNPSPLLQALLQDLSPEEILMQKLQEAFVENPSMRLGEGQTFREGYAEKLDKIRFLQKNGKQWLLSYQEKIKQELGIKTLKIGYNKIFGYYLEVSRAQASLVPSSFQRKQTLVNGERFISPELKEFEHQTLSAQEQAKAIEQQLFAEIQTFTVSFIPSVRKTAKALAQIDVLLSLAIVALEQNYHKPHVHTGYELCMTKSRHPIVEKTMQAMDFVPNDVSLKEDASLYIITGPNMAGKSTYIRQLALLILLAQMGSFIPAENASIPIVDRLFSRVGAQDDLARGQSTFMVEMSQTAYILQNATKRSFIILDEIGRGTSTYDGIAIAWSVAEELVQRGVKTVFATHYAELNALQDTYSQVVNKQVAVEENPSGIVFLRKILDGGTDKSYGIHVAKLAGIPFSVIQKAQAFLQKLEQDPLSSVPLKTTSPEKPSPYQSFIQEFAQLSLDTYTPKSALDSLYELQQKAQDLLLK